VKQIVELAQKPAAVARCDQPLRQNIVRATAIEQGRADAMAGHVDDQAVHALTISSAAGNSEIVAAHRFRGNAAARR